LAKLTLPESEVAAGFSGLVLKLIPNNCALVVPFGTFTSKLPWLEVQVVPVIPGSVVTTIGVPGLIVAVAVKVMVVWFTAELPTGPAIGAVTLLTHNQVLVPAPKDATVGGFGPVLIKEIDMTSPLLIVTPGVITKPQPAPLALESCGGVAPLKQEPPPRVVVWVAPKASTATVTELVAAEPVLPLTEIVPANAGPAIKPKTSKTKKEILNSLVIFYPPF
jgi:hypothetical protein